MSRVVHFEIHASDPTRLIEFYAGLFAWQFKAWGPPNSYWLIDTAPGIDPVSAPPGINGGLVPRMGGAPTEGQAVNAFMCTVSVNDCAASLARVVELGGSVALPLMPIPGVGWLGYGKDPDGNIFGLMQRDEAAK